MSSVDIWVIGTFAANAVVALYAVRQFRLSRISSEQELRAYVLIDSAELTQIGNAWTAFLKIRNFGKTPAYDTTVTIESGWHHRQDSTRVLPITDNKLVHPGVVIAPEHPLNVPMAIKELRGKPENWNFLAELPERPFVWGSIAYTDAFGHARWTRFQLFTDLDGVLALAHCAAGNECDK